MNNAKPVKSSKSHQRSGRKARAVRFRKRSIKTEQTSPSRTRATGSTFRHEASSGPKKARNELRRTPGKRIQKGGPARSKRILRTKKLGTKPQISGSAKVVPKPVGRTKKSTGKSESEGEITESLKWMEEDPKDHLLSRFIYDSKGKSIGESIGVEKGRLIMKSGKEFYSIPLKNIKERETDLALKGQIDKKKARKLGEIWRKKALDPLYQKNV